jgi:predicted component of type VI protein secretion system
MTAVLVLILRLALAVALYAFLGWTLLTLWRELKQQGEFLALQKRPEIKLHAKLENGQELWLRYSQPEVIVGRDPNCDFPVNDESISARHARIAFHHNQWWLEDLGSTNGIFIGKSRVLVPTVLINDEEFQCGNTVFTVEMNVVDEKLDL